MSTIDLLAIPDLHDGHGLDLIVDLVKDAVVALPNAVLVVAGQLLAAVGSWLKSKRPQSVDNALAVCLRQIGDLSDSGPFDLDPYSLPRRFRSPNQ